MGTICLKNDGTFVISWTGIISERYDIGFALYDEKVFGLGLKLTAECWDRKRELIFL